MSAPSQRSTLKKQKPLLPSTSASSSAGWVRSSNDFSDMYAVSRTMRLASEPTGLNHPAVQSHATTTGAIYAPSTSAPKPGLRGRFWTKWHSSYNYTPSAERELKTVPLENPQDPASDWRYWAVRALRAETMVARHAIYRMTESSNYEDLARKTEELHISSRKFRTSAQQYKVQRLEKIIWFLVLCLVLVLILLYHTIFSSTNQRSKPWHFTIPILSPFASVVEHESSLIGSKTMIFCGSIIAILVYFMFRHWLSHSNKRSYNAG